MSDMASHWLKKGENYPYDNPDERDVDESTPPLPPVDWAHAAARGVVANLKDRRAIKWGFENVDEETRAEIITSLAAIIRLAAGGDNAGA
ncbi:MAG: hypothetical protein ACAH27_06050 [Xanthobacteraceae bacterium]